MFPSCKFGKFIIPGAHLFYESALSVAFVNLKPILPGHVLVIPKRTTVRFAELSKEEVADLWAAVHHIAPILEGQYNCGALNLAIQDGRSAGQSVPHVHVHILPVSETKYTYCERFGSFSSRLAAV
jgi:diadenosine tetraphosphate (Ap4A) HIT family hydrolase